MGKGKVQFTLIFYLNNNGKVQVDLQHFEIFIFFGNFAEFAAWVNEGRKVKLRILSIWNMREIHRRFDEYLAI